MRSFVIVNPQSRGGKTAGDAPVIVDALRRALGEVTVTLTTRRGEATTLTRRALADGYARIIVVGGDGTANEVVNGFFDAETPINAAATLGIIPSGTGGDFRRTLGINSGLAAAVEQLQTTPARALDVGHVEYLDAQGTAVRRHFLNIASFGLSGDVVDRRERSTSGRAGGSLSYVVGALGAIANLRAHELRVTIDAEPPVSGALVIGAVCNGRYFGGGMHVAPNAVPDDGLFDIVLLRGRPSRMSVLARLTELFRGTHVAHESVRVMRGQTVRVESALDAIVRLEIDGEAGGRLPATFTIKPRALRVHG